MRRLLTWLAGVVGGLAAYRAVTRRRRAAAETAPEAPDERVEELREKLAQARAPEEEPPHEPADPAERRRAVHEQGRAALDEMRGD